MLGLPTTFWYLWLGALVNRLGGFVYPFLALYLTHARGLPVEVAGLIVALYGAGSTASGPVGGVLADRLGRRATMLVATLTAAAAMLQLGFARATWHIAVAALLLGFTSDIYRPALAAAIADVVPSASRTRAYGYLYWAINLGFSISALVAGQLADSGFTVLFIADAATTFGFGLVVFARVPETRPAVRPSEAGAARGDMLAPYRDRTFMAFVGIQLLVAVVFQQGAVALPVDMRAHGVSPKIYGVLIALNGVLIVLVQPLAVRVLSPLRRANVLAWGALLTGAGFGLTAFAGGAPVYAASIVVWTLGEIAFSTVVLAVVADLAPVHLRGGYQGTYQVSWGLSSALAPALGSLVLGRLGGDVLWAGCFLVGAAAAGLHLALAASRRHPALDAVREAA